MNKEQNQDTKNQTQPTTLKTMIEFQNDAIVSKTILNKESGTVTLFAFDQGQHLSEHTAPFDAIAYILQGEMEFTISKHPLRLVTGQIVILPANKPHALHANRPTKMLLTMIRSP
jgi:quercetin dioxygenase-like cupin family protein